MDTLSNNSSQFISLIGEEKKPTMAIGNSSGNMSATAPMPYQDTPLESALIYLGITIGVLSIVLNIMFLFAMRYLKDTSAAYHHFLKNLSLADVLASCSFLVMCGWPQMAYGSLASQNVKLLRLISYILRSLPWVFFTVYVLTLTCLTINQYLAVCRPWRYSALVTPRMLTVSLVIIWLLSALQMLVPLTVSLALWSDPDDQVFFEKLNEVSSIEMQVWMSFFAITLFANIILNIIIYQKIRHLKLKRRSHSPNNPESTNIRMKQKAFVTVVLLLATSIFCRLPFPLAGIIGINFPSHLIDAGIVLLLYLNFFVDPIIYFIRMKEVRKTYRRMLASCARCSPCCEISEEDYMTRTVSMRNPSLRTEVSQNALNIESVSLNPITHCDPVEL